MNPTPLNTPRFSYQTAAPAAPQTLNDMRIIPDYHEPQGTFSANSMKPMILSALIVAGLAGTAIGVHRYLENSSEKSAATTVDTSLPAASQAPVTDSTFVSPPAPTLKDTPAVDPVAPITKAEEPSPVTKPNPVTAKEAAKPAPRVRNVPAQVAPTPAPITATEITPPAREATPPSPPVVEPIAPPPAPIVEPVPTTPPEPPKQ